MIKTGLYLKNKQQTQDIARGLADTSARLEITELEYKIRYGDHDIEEYDIIITDRDGFDQYHPKVLILGGKWWFEYYDEYESLKSFESGNQQMDDNSVMAGIEEAMDDIRHGRVTEYESADDMFKKLGIWIRKSLIILLRWLMLN